jgi:signal transduction histidine kinase
MLRLSIEPWSDREVFMAGKPIRVLLVEDNNEDARLVKWALSKAQTPFDVQRASCLAEAVEWIAVDRYGAIVSDLGLPDVPRCDTVRQIRQQAPQVPLVVLTGLADDSAALDALEAGAEDYLVKDRITPDSLDRAIRYAIQRQRNTEIRGLLEKMRASERMLERKNRRLAKLYRFAHHSVDDVSHEFRTPLTIITEYVSLLRDGIVGEVTSEQTRMLNIVADRANDLDNMVNDMLDVSKLKTGLLGLYRENCRVTEIIEHVRPSLERKAAIRKARFTIEVENDLPEVYCDAEKIGRVIVNLVVNAIKYCGDPGDVRLWARYDAARCEVVVGVNDNGPGIKPGELARLFRRFKQLDSKPRGGAKGFGLGLTIAKQLVKLNLGQLSVDSQPNAGSTFAFSLPEAKLETVLPRYLASLKRYRHRPNVASIVTASIDPATPAQLAAEFNAFLNCTLRQNDLLFGVGRGKWLVVLPIERVEVDAFIARARRLHQQANRNRPHGPLPAAEFRMMGAWRVVGQCANLLNHIQGIVESGRDGTAAGCDASQSEGGDSDSADRVDSLLVEQMP